MAKEVEIIVTAKDQASATFDKIWNSSKSFSDKIKANMNTIKIASWIAFAWLLALWKQMVTDAMFSIEQETKLTTVLKQRTNATEAQIKAIKDMTVAQQKLWIIEDDTQVAWLQQLWTFVTQTKSLEVLWPAMNNLIAQQKGFNATQGDAINIWNLMWKVLQWQTSALTRVWISFTEAQEKVLKFWTESERSAMLAQVITDNVWQMNEALAWTFQGRMTQLKNTLWDVGETIGGALIPVLQKVVEAIVPIVEKVADRINENPKLAWNILLVATAVAGLTLAMTFLAPAIATVLALMWWPMWFIALVWLLFIGLNALEGAIVSTDEKVAWYNKQIADLTAQYKLGTISQEEYKIKLAELQAQITTAETQSKTLWQTLRDDLDATLKMMLSPIDSAKEAFRNFWIIVDAIGGAFDRLAEKIWTFFVQKIQSAIKAVKDVYNSVSSMFGVWSSENIVAKWLNALTWKRASGWPVSANWTYLVGEKWPELFVPPTWWNIVPNNQLWWQTVNINLWWVVVNDQADENRLVQKISDALKRQNQLYSLGIN